MLAGAIALAALRARALTRDGAGAAFVVGTLTYGAGGIAFTLVLLAFFVSSVALSRIGRARKKQLVDIGKGGARDALQVLANGGVATICAVIAAISVAGQFSEVERPWYTEPLWLAAFAGAYAAATADTWGTEIGTLIRGTPRSILNLRPIATGLSGGITVAGTLAEIAGAVWIAIVSIAAFAAFIRVPSLALPRTTDYALIFFSIAVGGVAGAVVDSLLGATVQELRRCPACERACETNPHVCGTRTTLVRGLRGFSNDLVNAAATLAGAATAYLAALLQFAFHSGG